MIDKVFDDKIIGRCARDAFVRRYRDDGDRAGTGVLQTMFASELRSWASSGTQIVTFVLSPDHLTRWCQVSADEQNDDDH